MHWNFSFGYYYVLSYGSILILTFDTADCQKCLIVAFDKWGNTALLLTYKICIAVNLIAVLSLDWCMYIFNQLFFDSKRKCVRIFACTVFSVSISILTTFKLQTYKKTINIMLQMYHKMHSKLLWNYIEKCTWPPKSSTATLVPLLLFLHTLPHICGFNYKLRQHVRPVIAALICRPRNPRRPLLSQNYPEKRTSRPVTDCDGYGPGKRKHFAVGCKLGWRYWSKKYGYVVH